MTQDRPWTRDLGHRLSWRHDALLVGLLSTAALFLRAFFPYGQVFLDDYVRFRGTDAWYHMRLVENLLHHFPHSIAFDPYLRPGGEFVTEAPLFDLLLAGVAWIAGAGQPSDALIETLGAWYPAILGTLVTIPVYLLAQLVWRRPAGLVAGGLVAVFPGRFLERSLLGATDHHVAEILWSTTTLLFLVLALRQTRRGAGVGWAILAGAALAAYLLSWRSGTGLVFLLLAWVVAQVASDLRRGVGPRDLGRVILPFWLAALLLVVPWLDGHRVPARHASALALALLASAALVAASSRINPRGLAGRWWLPALGALGLLAGLIVLALAVTDAGGLFGRLRPEPWGLTVAEMRPLGADDSLVPALWRELTTGALAALAGGLLLLRRVYREGRPADLLLLVWALGILAVSLVQRRFASYLAVVAALLGAGAATWLWRRFRGSRGRFLVPAAVFLALFAPNVAPAIARASRPAGPDPAWHAAARWLRSNSPEPFADPRYFDARYPAPPAPGLGPRAAYGVMAWWDRGHWLIRVARRVPVANPKGHGIPRAAAFFLARDEASASLRMDQAGARFVVVDDEMPIRQTGGSEIAVGSLYSMTVWREEPVERFVERYELRSGDGDWRPVYLYYPAYFQTLAIRLQTFAGRAVTPRDASWVVSFDRHVRSDGVAVKRVTGLRRFPSHAAAAEILGRQDGGRHRLVSVDPALSCVPLEPLRRFHRVYPTAAAEAAAAPVKVFEYRDEQPVLDDAPPEIPQENRQENP